MKYAASSFAHPAMQLMFPDIMLYRLGLSCYYGYLHSKYTCTNLHYKLTL